MNNTNSSCVCEFIDSDEFCECSFPNPSLENELYEVCEKVANFDPAYDEGLYDLCGEVEHRIMSQRKGKFDRSSNAKDIARLNENFGFKFTDPENKIPTEIHEKIDITRKKRPRLEDESTNQPKLGKTYRTHVKIITKCTLNSNKYNYEETYDEQNEESNKAAKIIQNATKENSSNYTNCHLNGDNETIYNIAEDKSEHKQHEFDDNSTEIPRNNFNQADNVCSANCILNGGVTDNNHIKGSDYIQNIDKSNNNMQVKAKTSLLQNETNYNQTQESNHIKNETDNTCTLCRNTVIQTLTAFTRSEVMKNDFLIRNYLSKVWEKASANTSETTGRVLVFPNGYKWRKQKE